jgi:toxin-antitoxin system PIN domain toxin
VIACDVNVLIYAYNDDEPRTAEYRAWLEGAANGPEPFGLSSVVASGFLRIVTHPKVLATPLSTGLALDLLEDLRAAPAVVAMEPGRRHWSIFSELCRTVSARGNTAPDAYLAAIAIEHGCVWHSADRGFARYPGLRWRHPLDPGSAR